MNKFFNVISYFIKKKNHRKQSMNGATSSVHVFLFTKEWCELRQKANELISGSGWVKTNYSN